MNTFTHCNGCVIQSSCRGQGRCCTVLTALNGLVPACDTFSCRDVERAASVLMDCLNETQPKVATAAADALAEAVSCCMVQFGGFA